MTGERRPRRRRWPLLTVLAGIALLTAGLVGWSTRDQPTGLPTPIAAGIATALAHTPLPDPAPASTTNHRHPSSPDPSTSHSRSSDVPSTRPPSSSLFRLQIPTLHIDAPIVPVGVDSAGEMTIPTNIHTLGWYRYGPAPGAQAGSIVIVGHVDSATQGLGTFFNLETISAAATITITTTDDHRWRYRVVGRQAYPKTSIPLTALFSTTGAPRLTLITCGGKFNRSDHSYLDNIVITARPT